MGVKKRSPPAEEILARASASRELEPPKIAKKRRRPVNEEYRDEQMGRTDLIAKALDYLHLLCDEYGHEIDEEDMEELETLIDKLENIQQGWFDEESE